MRKLENCDDVGTLWYNGDAMENKPPKCFLDAFLLLRPGAFASNVDLLLKLARMSARAGHKQLVLPSDAVQGGDCGSLATHPAFVKACAKAETRFLNGLSKIKNLPKVVWVARGQTPEDCDDFSCSIIETLITEAGPDPRFPFGGRPEEVFPRQVCGLARRLAAIGCKDAVIGLSGGLDSALALLVTVGAFKLLELDLKGIHVYTMPGFGTTKRTRGNADMLAEGLGLKLETIDITPACRQHFKDIRQPASRPDMAFENAQARERTQILMDKANQFGGIVVGTGDMSEIALGWCTYNGDHMSMFGVNAGVPKTVVREVCRWIVNGESRKVNGEGLAKDATDPSPVAIYDSPSAAKALLDILETPVSPELLPAKRGKIAQKTEDKVGPYELHDFFLWHFVQDGEGRRQILAAAKKAFKGQYDAKTIARWLDVFFRRFFSQAFKRNCAPDGVQVFSVYLSPSAWHIPSDMSGAVFR